MNRKEIGNEGEVKSVQFLKEKGYQIIERNYRKQIGEIDLIAKDPVREEIVFVEVKTRRTQNFGFPEESITKRKREKIEQLAQCWLNEKKLEGSNWRIDVLSLEWRQVETKIKHLENIE